jgi:hypothetical protein
MLGGISFAVPFGWVAGRRLASKYSTEAIQNILK